MKPICSVPDCSRPVMCKGWCSPHYYKLRPAPPCSIEGCGKSAKSKGMCDAHFMRQKRHGDPEAGGIARGETQRWIADHQDYVEDRCLTWPFARSDNGYGVTTVAGDYALAHRVMCEAVNGPAPTVEHEAAHSCGNGHEGCVNPLHLRWATKSENALDAMAHGTKRPMEKGERHKMAKLKDADVLAIRQRRAAGVSNAALCKEYGMSSASISRITTRQSWTHLP